MFLSQRAHTKAPLAGEHRIPMAALLRAAFVVAADAGGARGFRRGFHAGADWASKNSTSATGARHVTGASSSLLASSRLLHLPAAAAAGAAAARLGLTAMKPRPTLLGARAALSRAYQPAPPSASAAILAAQRHPPLPAAALALRAAAPRQALSRSPAGRHSAARTAPAAARTIAGGARGGARSMSSSSTTFTYKTGEAAAWIFIYVARRYIMTPW